MSALTDSQEARHALTEAHRLAARAGRAPTSYELLLCLYACDNRARELLRERHVVLAQLMRPAVARALPPEPDDTLEGLWRRAQQLADKQGAARIDCLHVLVALLGPGKNQATQALRLCGVDAGALRSWALERLDDRAGRSANPGVHPALGPPRGGAGARHLARHGASHPSRAGGRVQVATALQPPTPIVPAPDEREQRLIEVLQVDTGMQRQEAANAPVATPWQRPVWPDAPPPTIAARLAEQPGESMALAIEDAELGEGELLQDDGLTPDGQEGGDSDDENAEIDPSALPLHELAPALAECSCDLTERAHANALDRAIGRSREIELVCDVLAKRRSNNPVLVGPPGVGKTAIVEGLARIWAGLDDGTPEPNRRLVALDTGQLVAGTSLRGSFAERMAEIKAEVARHCGHLVIFIDEIHTLLGAGAAGEGAQDAAQELKAALARGAFPCIGATTDAEYRRYIERDAALERRLCAIEVREPTCEEATDIVRRASGSYEQFHQLRYSEQAITAAVELSHRFVHERHLPDKAFAALDLAGARARRRNVGRVEREDIAQVIHSWTNIPIARLLQNNSDKLAQTQKALGEHIAGHRDAIATLMRTLHRGFAGLHGARPLGSFLLTGPSGSGKTELCRTLAEQLFGRRDALVRIDMAELSEKHSIARLLGAQPGYIGHEEGGLLTEAIRKRPFALVLFDDVERAHADVLGILSQLLEEGTLTDTQGRKISFAQTVVMLTANSLGDEPPSQSHTTYPHLEVQRDAGALRPVGYPSLPQALVGRVDARLTLQPLSRQELGQVAFGLLQQRRSWLQHERSASLGWGAEVIPALLEMALRTPQDGARAVRRAVASAIDDPLAHLVLRQELSRGMRVHIVKERQRDGLALRLEPAHGDVASPALLRPTAVRPAAHR